MAEITKCGFMKVPCLFASLFCATAWAEPTSAILVVVDDPGHGDFRATTQVQMGNIESLSDIRTNGRGDILSELSSRSVVFERAYATHSYCAPSRAGMLLGTYQQKTGFYYNPEEGTSPSAAARGLRPSDVLWPSLLKEAGFQTAMFGKWHLGIEPLHAPHNFGFNKWFGFLYGARPYFPQSEEQLRGGLCPADSVGNLLDARRLRHNGTVVPEDTFEHLTDEFTRRAVAWWQSTSGPRFMYVAYNAPHTPLNTLPNDFSRVSHLSGRRRSYAALCLNLDRNIRRVFDLVDDNTLLVFTGDNGGADPSIGGGTNAPLRGHKGRFYEGGVRVPLVFHANSLTPKVYKKPVSLLDIGPTILARNGLSLSNSDGVNLLPFVQGDDPSNPHKYLYWKCPKTLTGFDAAILNGDWKLLRMLTGAVRLHHVDNEFVNVTSTHPTRVATMLAELEKWEATLRPPRWGSVPVPGCESSYLIED